MNGPSMDSTPPAKASRLVSGRFVWEDPLLLEEQLTDDERMIRDAAHRYAQLMLGPRLHDVADICGDDDGLIAALSHPIGANGDEGGVLHLYHDLLDRRHQIGLTVRVLGQDRGEKLDQRLAGDARSLVLPHPTGHDLNPDVPAMGEDPFFAWSRPFVSVARCALRGGV